MRTSVTSAQWINRFSGRGGFHRWSVLRLCLAHILAAGRIVFAADSKVRLAGDLQRGLAAVRLLCHLAEAVGLGVRQSVVVAVHVALAVTMVAVHRTTRRVDRNLIAARILAAVIHSQSEM
jgi:hypothetical protein